MDLAKADFLQLFEEHHVPLYRFAYRMTGSVADAEDIVQECFWNCCGQGAPTIRRGLDSNLFIRRGAKPITEAAAAEAMVRRSEAHCGRRRARCCARRWRMRSRGLCGALPDAQREVLILAHYEQMALAEIAARAGHRSGRGRNRVCNVRAPD